MPEQATDPNARFDGFWRHRHCLDEAQWLDFRQLVFEILRPCRFTELAGLPDAGDTCIDDFFVDRIFDPAKKASPSEDKPVTLGYLVIMFRHYLSDRLRDPWLNRRTETGDALDDIPVEIAPLATLDDHGLTDEQIRRAADDFLVGRPPWEKLAGELWWIRPYLACHFCADKSEALSALARRLGIPAHHYKAVQLGITSAKDGFPNPSAFRATHLGRWLDQVGIDVNCEEGPALARIALQLLCQAALYGELAAAPS